MTLPGAFAQLHAGRSEPILEPELPIIDAHHHLFDRPALRYMVDDYLADARAGHRIVASVYVETLAFAHTEGPQALRPLGEIEFADGVGARAAASDCRVCAAIVGHADLRLGDAVAPLLDAALERAPERFRGIRQVSIEHPSETPFRYMTHRPPQGVLQSPGFRTGFAHLARRGLSFDAAVFHQQMPDIATLADAFPDTTIILNHSGLAMAMEMSDAERARVFREWRDGLRELARRPNVLCKVGGFGMPFWGFGFERRTDPVGSLELAEAWRPFVEQSIAAFGAERCMLESNYPPDGRSCGYVPLWNAFKQLLRGASAHEKAALFHGTAARVYRVDLGRRSEGVR